METALETAAPPPKGQLRPRTSPTGPFELELRFTDVYRESSHEHPAIREARCLAVQFPATLCSIEDGDLLAGRISPALVGFSPDEWGSTAFGFYHIRSDIERGLNDLDLSPALCTRVREMLSFWDGESTAARIRAAYPSELAAVLPSDDWMNSPGVAFPLYRLTGGNLDYQRLLDRGIRGLREDVANRRDRGDLPSADSGFLTGLLLALDVLESVCIHYRDEALRLADSSGASRREELLELARALHHISADAPSTFLEAAQLMWLYSITSDCRNHGRMDVYLGPFLTRDLDAGHLDEARALAITQSLWQLMADRQTRVHNRVIVGGRGRPDAHAADRFTALALEASRTVLEAEPQLSLRFFEDTDKAIIDQAMDVIAEGRTFPMLYNDDVNIPAVMKAFGLPEETAEQYVPYGCGEFIIDHQSFGTPSGVINLLKALEVTLSGGIDLTTGERMGLDSGGLLDFETFDQLWDAYREQVEYHVRHLADQQKLEYEVAGDHSPFLLTSLLYDDCLERGRALLDGGIRYLGGTLETYGNVNTADALLAIRQNVYERGEISRDELLEALKSDFDGHIRTQHLLRNAPKYGNDVDDADEMLVRVHEHVCNFTREQALRVGLDSYLVVVINNAANSLMGQWTAASADGRRAATPMNNGNAPSSGNDMAGPTAMLNSILKPRCDIHAGAVQNMKFSKQIMREHRPVVDALLDAYFENGGPQAMITVVGKEDLERALEEPLNYRHVFVRVGGFSARFVDLPRNVQLEILNRTLY